MMCVAIPGKVISVADRKADVDFNGNIVRADSGLVEIKEGDRVLVHAGCIIQKLSDEDADFMEDFYRDLETLSG